MPEGQAQVCAPAWGGNRCGEEAVSSCTLFALLCAHSDRAGCGPCQRKIGASARAFCATYAKEKNHGRRRPFSMAAAWFRHGVKKLREQKGLDALGGKVDD
jgi:hypothetical protein